MPIPIHAQVAQAQRDAEARADALRASVAETARIIADLVTDHGLPTYYRGPVPRNARALVAVAAAAGFETKILEHRTGCRVEGFNRDRALGFTASWERGRAKGATWNTPWRYGIVEDRRPIGVHKTARVALAKKRGAGVGTTRLAILGSPWGVGLSHTELTERLQEEAS